MADRRAIPNECQNYTVGGTCRCQPKCLVCGFGPHMAVHLGTRADPQLAYDHQYEPPHIDGAAWFEAKEPTRGS